MADSNFIDYVKIYCRSGKGGAGSPHFRRTRSNAKGGPDGGDGGDGGHIILKGDRNKWTLIHLKYRKHIFAENGQAGQGNQKFGAQGQSQVLEVPLGTVVRHAETNKILGEVTEHGEEFVVFEGGKGGKGNVHFKTATNQAPRYAQPGLPGVEDWIILELKLLADVGLVGFPNAGKSTLLASISAAKPQIADYAFTTLEPNLGIVEYRNQQSFVMADIPGIIEGAAEGKGLGIRFLRHIERNATLLFLIPADADNIAREYHILLSELKKYNPELLDKPRVIAISKADLLDDELQDMIAESLEGLPHLFFSSVTGQGISQLKDTIWTTINA